MISISDSNDVRISNGNVCLLFSATWCGPCRMLKPAMEKMASTHEGKLAVYTVDVDECQDLAAVYNVKSVPTAVVLQDGNVVDIMHGQGGIDIDKILHAVAC